MFLYCTFINVRNVIKVLKTIAYEDTLLRERYEKRNDKRK